MTRGVLGIPKRRNRRIYGIWVSFFHYQTILSFVFTILENVPGISELHCMADKQQLLMGGWEEQLALTWMNYTVTQRTA